MLQFFKECVVEPDFSSKYISISIFRTQPNYLAKKAVIIYMYVLYICCHIFVYKI